MAEKRKVEIVVSARNEASGELDAVREKVRKTGKEINDLGKGKGGDGKGGFFETAKKRFGEESDLGNLGKLAVGAGAVAGVALIANVATKAAEGIAAVRDGLKTGAMNAREVTDGLVGAIPIVGKLGIALDEVFSGRRAAERAKEQADAITKSVRKTVRAVGDATELAGLEGVTRDRRAMEQARKAERQTFADQMAEESKGLTGADELRARADLFNGLAAIDKRYAAERAAFERDRRREREESEREHVRRIADIREGGRAADLKAAGRDAEASVLQVRAALDAEVKAIAADAVKQKQARGKEEWGTIDLQAAELESAARNRSADEERRALRAGESAEAARVRERAERMRDAETEATAAILEARGRSYEAQQLQAANAHLREMEEIDAQLAERKRALSQGPDDARSRQLLAAAEQEAERLRASANARTAAQRRAAERAEEFRKADQQTDVESRLAQLRVDALQQQAEAGDALARQDAERLAIAEQYRQKQEEIARALRDQTLTDEQRARLQAAGREAGVQGQVAQALAAARRMDPTLAGRPSLVSGRFIEGGLAEDPRLRQRQPMDELIKIARRQAEASQKAADALARIGQTRLAGLFTTGYGT